MVRTALAWTTPANQAIHQPRHRAAGDRETLLAHLPLNLVRSTDREVPGEDPENHWLERLILPCPRRLPCWIAPLGPPFAVGGGGGDRQDLADRLDPISALVIVDEGDHPLTERTSSAWAE